MRDASLRFSLINLVCPIIHRSAPDELDKIKDGSIEYGKRENAGDDEQIPLFDRLSQALSRDVLGHVRLLEVKHDK